MGFSYKYITFDAIYTSAVFQFQNVLKYDYS